MFKNLKAEMKRQNVTANDLAIITGVKVNSIYKKLNGQSDFKAREMFLIKNNFFKNLDIQYLFEMAV